MFFGMEKASLRLFSCMASLTITRCGMTSSVCPAPWAGAHHPVEAAEAFFSFAGKEQEILAVRKREVATMPREGVLEGLSASAARIRPEVMRDLVAVWNEGLAWPSAISDYTG